MGVTALIFEPHPPNLKNVQMMLNGFLISLLVSDFQRSVWECSVHICSCPCINLPTLNSILVIGFRNHDNGGLDLWKLTFRQETFWHGQFIMGTFWHEDISAREHFSIVQSNIYILADILAWEPLCKCPCAQISLWQNVLVP
jgi:hypothetical protein